MNMAMNVEMCASNNFKCLSVCLFVGGNKYFLAVIRVTRKPIIGTDGKEGAKYLQNISDENISYFL